MKIDTRIIGKFLKNIPDVEYCYLKHCMGMRDSIATLIERHKLTKEDVCAHFEIKPAKYNGFIKGDYNYDLRDLARLNAYFMELESEKLKEKVPVKIDGEQG